MALQEFPICCQLPRSRRALRHQDSPLEPENKHVHLGASAHNLHISRSRQDLSRAQRRMKLVFRPPCPRAARAVLGTKRQLPRLLQLLGPPFGSVLVQRTLARRMLTTGRPISHSIQASSQARTEILASEASASPRRNALNLERVAESSTRAFWGSFN